MLDLFRQLKLEYKDYIILFKSGNFYLSFDEDAIVLNKIFNYKIGSLKNNIKVGFPISNININISILKDKRINYIVIEDKTIKDKITFDDNSFYDYYEGVFNYISINNRINNIYKILNEMDNDNLKLELIIKIEELLNSYSTN